MKQTIAHSPAKPEVDIQQKQVVLQFPNGPTVNFSLNIPDLRCAGFSPTYTYKAWVWCAYINALHAARMQLGYKRNQELFQEIWRKIKSSGR